MAAQEIQLDPIYAEALTPDEYIKVYQTSENEIKSARVIPPQLGSPGFGKILVRWKRPIYSRWSETIKTHGRSSKRRRAK